MKSLAAAIAGVFAFAFAFTVAAQPYPAKPLRLIVPVPPGGTADALCREIAARMSTGIGQQVLVDNRAGANGMIGADILAKAAPDGYTIGLMSSSHSAVPHVSKLPFDPLQDFIPLTLIAIVPLALKTQQTRSRNSRHSFAPRWTRTAGSFASLG